jgi:hypothetical protein
MLIHAPVLGDSGVYGSVGAGPSNGLTVCLWVNANRWKLFPYTARTCAWQHGALWLAICNCHCGMRPVVPLCDCDCCACAQWSHCVTVTAACAQWSQCVTVSVSAAGERRAPVRGRGDERGYRPLPSPSRCQRLRLAAALQRSSTACALHAGQLLRAS